MLYFLQPTFLEQPLQEFSARNVIIRDSFWSPRLQVNSKRAIFHQWKMLEASGCINNFRIAAGEMDSFREGWFFADSDATKWLDAAARIERNEHDEQLCTLMDEFIRLLGKTQCADGYLFTYNQIHFPGQRWVNLQIEHELYCHGHLIEAGVSHFEATGSDTLLLIARKAADLLVRDFLHTGAERTPGHEEVEIALLRLWQITGEASYRDLAQHFLESRGRTRGFGIKLARQFASNNQRGRYVEQARKEFYQAHPEKGRNYIPAANQTVRPKFSIFRFIFSALSGRYFQQHAPIRKQIVPAGHAVRFGYLETAQAMLLRDQPDAELLKTMQRAWNHMVTRRMDGTGGLGALPDLEGFGRDYELNPESAYNETCAALASLFWNWQMGALTGDARYSDLFEWQLYNAVSVGMGWTGESYLYNNPTLCRGGIVRQPWYSIPCCPSNLSRTFADLGKYIFSFDENSIWVNQYIGCISPAGIPQGVSFEMKSELPWNGNISIRVHTPAARFCTIHLRIPSWAGGVTLKVNGEVIPVLPIATGQTDTASGVDPRRSTFFPVTREWREDDLIELFFDMPVRLLLPNRRVRGLRGRTSVTRGPLVYCLESTDNPGLNIFESKVEEHSFSFFEDKKSFGGIIRITAKTPSSQDLVFLPYALWGNRGPSQMTVWVKLNK
jgi:uncharacterized protein